VEPWMWPMAGCWLIVTVLAVLAVRRHRADCRSAGVGVGDVVGGSGGGVDVGVGRGGVGGSRRGVVMDGLWWVLAGVAVAVGVAMVVTAARGG
jgi:hypothetical protein